MRKIILPLLATALTFFACNHSQPFNSQTPVPGETAQPVLTSSEISPPVEPVLPAESKSGERQVTTPATIHPASANVPKTAPVQGKSATSSPANAATNTPTNATSATVIPTQVPENQAIVEKRPAPTPAPSSQKNNETPTPSPVSSKGVLSDRPTSTVSHEAWDKLLQQYVTASGKVNYTGFKKDKSLLDAYLKTLQDNPPQNNWSRGEKMAFWINAYNAFTVKLIVDNFPLTSITKLDGGKPWDVKRISIGGKTYSLNNIENDLLRPTFKDARIHFALNCAAKSCPPLLHRAWTAANLESNFEKQAKAFVNNPAFNKISAKEAQVSKIFEWYAADFGSLTEFLNKYSDTKLNAGGKLTYMEYDWALNGQ